MDEHNHTHSIELTGEVVGIFERDARKIVKLSLKPQCVDLPLPWAIDPHLGDTLRLEMAVSPRKGEMVISSADDGSSPRE